MQQNMLRNLRNVGQRNRCMVALFQVVRGLNWRHALTSTGADPPSGPHAADRRDGHMATLAETSPQHSPWRFSGLNKASGLSKWSVASKAPPNEGCENDFIQISIWHLAALLLEAIQMSQAESASNLCKCLCHVWIQIL